MSLAPLIGHRFYLHKRRNANMVNVSARAKSVKQPKGGYLNPKDMDVIEYDDGQTLGPECLHPTTMGMVIDYLTRFMCTGDKESAFRISLRGGVKADREEYTKELLNSIHDKLDDESITNACRLVLFDSYVRAGRPPGIEPEKLTVDVQTCDNVRIMINRSLNFVVEYGPICKYGFVFIGGYTKTVNTGDGDFVTKDTLWDFKVSKYPPTKENTLQLLMYFLMGKRSIFPELQRPTKIGIFNPRLNTVYTYEVEKIDKDIIEEIKRDVIGYDDP